MSDLFHEHVPTDYIARVGDVMRRADWHIFQVLTKRDVRMRELRHSYREKRLNASEFNFLFIERSTVARARSMNSM